MFNINLFHTIFFKLIYAAEDLKKRPKRRSVSNLLWYLTVIKLKWNILILQRFR